MAYVINAAASVRATVGPDGVQWVVVAPLRHGEVRRTTVSVVDTPAVHALFTRAGEIPDGALAVDGAAAEELAAIGLLLPAGDTSPPVRFTARLADRGHDAGAGGRLVLNQRLRFSDQPPTDGPLEAGRVVVVTDPVRDIELPYWIDAVEESLIRALLGGAPPGALPVTERAKLAAAGILHDPQRTELERRALADQWTMSRHRIESHGYAVFGSLLPPLFVQSVADYYRRMVAEGRLPFIDPHMTSRYYMVDERFGTWLHERMTAVVQRGIPRPIMASYSYVAAYVEGAALGPHTDRAQCEYSLSLALDATPDASADAAWPLCLESPADEGVVQVLLAPGDGLLFRGTRLRHFRDPLAAGRTSTTLLLHFVDTSFTGPLK